MAPFAVVSATAGFQAAYDPNGNMIRRVENGATYRQEWDAKNRLAVVTHTSPPILASMARTYGPSQM